MNILLLSFSIAVLFALKLIFTSLLLPNTLNAWKIAALSLGVAAISVVNRLLFDVASTIFLFTNLSIIITIFCLPIFIYQGKMWKRYLVYSFFAILMGVVDIAGTALIIAIYGNINALLTEIMPVSILIASSIVLYTLSGSLSVLGWKMIAARKFQPFYLPFLILPVGLLITTYSFAYSEITILWVIGIFISLASNMILLIYVVSLDKKAAIEEELTETRHTMELEQQHYRKLELHRKELTDIRHDFNNQLATIGQLIRSGEEHSAQDMIHSLSKEIMKTAENPFCNIPVINAILTEKAQACASADIDLTIELNLPDTLSVENIHLCSIFGNLLDNAINACKAAAYDTPPNIHLSTMMDGDYLFIKVTNPSQTPPAKPAPGRGYGSRILSDLSQRYDGDYWTEYKEGVFTAVVSLVGV